MRLLPSRRHGRALLAALALHAPAALAHLGYPDTTSLTVRREHPEDMLLGATFGAVMTRDGGKSWRWLCPEAIGYGTWRPETYLWQPNGDLLAATGSALIRSKDAGCTWAAHPYFSAPDKPKSTWLWPIGLASPDSQPSRLWVSTARSGTHNGLYRSDDGGETFTATSLQSDSAVFVSVKVAPSDTRRLYVTSSAPDGMHLWRSDDEGVTWTDIPQSFPEYTTSSSRPYDLFAMKVSDTDPDRLWARVTAPDTDNDIWTYVMESRDGGHTFHSVVHPEDQAHDGVDEPLIGIEVSASGDTLWAATQTRLYRVHEGDATATHLPLPDGNACAQRQGDVLFVCGASRIHNWALATTQDEGTTDTPIFNLPDMLAPAAPFCPVGSPTHDLCRSYWPQFAPTIAANPTLPPDELTADAGTPASDAGTPDGSTPDAGPPPTTDPSPTTPETPPKKQGCTSTSGLVPTAALLTLTLLRRSRRHPPEPRS